MGIASAGELMEWILTAIIAPLLIAGVVAVFRLRGMAWVVGRPLRRPGAANGGRLFQSLTIFNGGGLTEEDVCLRFPDRLNVELAASTEGVASQDGSLVLIPSIASGDQCQLVILADEEITGATSVTLRSKGVKSGSYAKSEKEVTTAAALGGWLIAIIILLSGGAWIIRDVFFGEQPQAEQLAKSVPQRSAQSEATAKSWAQWESVGDFAKSELAKFYPSPSFPVVVGEFSRKGDVATLQVMFNNVATFPVNFSASLSSSVTSEDPEPWKRRESVRNLVVAPASQQQVLLTIYYPRSTKSGYVVLDGFIRYGEELHQFSKNVKVD